MSGINPSIIVASPSAAPHIALRSWLAAAAWRSSPAFRISPSAPPRAMTARTVVPGQRGCDGSGLPEPPPIGPGEPLPATGPTSGAEDPAAADDEPAGDGDPDDEPHAARTAMTAAARSRVVLDGPWAVPGTRWRARVRGPGPAARREVIPRRRPPSRGPTGSRPPPTRSRR